MQTGHMFRAAGKGAFSIRRCLFFRIYQFTDTVTIFPFAVMMDYYLNSKKKHLRQRKHSDSESFLYLTRNRISGGQIMAYGRVYADNKINQLNI